MTVCRMWLLALSILERMENVTSPAQKMIGYLCADPSRRPTPEMPSQFEGKVQIEKAKHSIRLRILCLNKDIRYI